MLKAEDVFVRMREITRSVKVLVAFASIVSNILLCMRRNGYLGTCGKSFGDLATFSVDFFCILYAECHSIPRPRFRYKVRNVCDLETISSAFFAFLPSP